MIHKVLIAFLLITSNTLLAQTWSDEVATIVYNKCSKCHHDGGVAPFSLMSFTEAKARANAMRDAIINKRMPPSPPDESYQQHAHSRALTTSESQTVLAWLDNNTPEGNAALTPPPPIFSSGALLGKGDLTLKMPNYRSKASSNDDYVCFSIPTTLSKDRKIRALEIIPGNREIVHHCLVYLDEKGTYPTDTIDGNCGGPKDSKLLMGYTPGASPLILPSGNGLKLGMTLKSGSNIVLAMHYPGGSEGLLDSTKVIFHFYPENESNIREVFAAPVLSNWQLSLPPNVVTSIEAKYPLTGGLTTNFSLLSVFPHMHLLGKEIKVFGITPQNDTLNYIHIPHWDFHWQDFYFFKNIQKAPIGSIIKGTGVYDNTENNHHNPSSPPVHVYAGESTTDEMFLVYFHFMPYQTGDENYNLEELMTLGFQDITKEQSQELTLFPNPFTEQTNIAIKDSKDALCYIYDYKGELITQLTPINNKLVWDGTNSNGNRIPAGVYYLSVNNKGQFSHVKVVKL